jgi:aspartate kinase
VNKVCVAKFGGSSVANYEVMQNCANVVLSNPNTHIVVLSASAGVTNLLVDLANGSLDEKAREETIQKIVDIQENILEGLGHPKELTESIQRHIEYIRSLAHEASLETNAALVDRMVSNGELMSTKLFAELLRQRGSDAVWFDVRKVMRTDSNYGKAAPVVEVIRSLAQNELVDLCRDKIVVTQGFIGANSDGLTTTLGRGGSDFSAALIGEAVDSSSIEIWTDVPGIYTTDPRLVSTAHPIPELTFEEAAEMATFGAKVLHPATIQPAVRRNIPVFVGSSKNPRAGGTWIRTKTESMPTFRAVAMRKNQVLLTLKSFNMIGACGFMATVFGIFAKHGLSVDLVTTSEVTVAITIDNGFSGGSSDGKSLLSEQLLKDLRQVCNVEVEEDLTLIAVIGNKMSYKQGIGSKVFSAIFDVNVRMISYGASSHGLCFLVDSKDGDEVIKRLHVHLLD